MYNYLKKSLSPLSVLAVSLFSLSVSAISAPLNSFKITDFRFGMNDPSYSNWIKTTGANPIDPSLYGTLVEDTYQGSNFSNVLTNFKFFGSEVYVYTASVNQGGTYAPNTTTQGMIPGGPPPTIDLNTLTADMSSWFATYNGTEFNQGNNSNFTACAVASEQNYYTVSPHANLLSSTATVIDNFDGTYRIKWNSCITGGDFNGQVGFWYLDVKCTTCVPTVLGSADILTVNQIAGTGTNVQTATTGGGDVVITSSHGISPANFLFTWSASDTAIVDIDGNITDGTFTFDPSGLTPGKYIIRSTYQDSNTEPLDTKGSGEIIIRIANSVTGDVQDDNGNRIENKDDAGLLAAQLQAELSSTNSVYALQASSGILRLGKTAFCAGKAARITQADLIANASDNCTTTNNSGDTTLKAVGIGGYYDFEVTGITQGETVDIVIPLTSKIPRHAVYRKYSEDGGWITFITKDNNKLSSAASTATGVCPSPTSDAYTTPLTAGDDCLRLSITDGGPNDTDNSANGLIKDPGAVAEINSGTEAKISGGCSISGQPESLRSHGEWLFVFAVLAWFGFTARSRKR